jgi:hypothetical protein
MKTSTSCSCHSHTDTDACASTGVLERPRYYARQLLTPAELTLEQQYFRDKMRRHNRLLHGWGVVCGAGVCLIPKDDSGQNPTTGQNVPPDQAKPWVVRVQPGYILGPYGDEILIDREVVFDLRTCGLTGVTGEPGEPADPWCADVYVQRQDGPLFVAVRYKEMQSRPVRVQPAGCGCDETQCEYSRWRDGYEICALAECPPSHQKPPKIDEIFRGGTLPDCPDCPSDPWVVLARVEIKADGTITKLEHCACRRQVASFGPFWWSCKDDRRPDVVHPTSGDEITDRQPTPEEPPKPGGRKVKPGGNK